VNNCKVCHRPLHKDPLFEFRDMPAIAQNFPGAGELALDRGVSFDVRQCSGCGLVQLTCEPVPYHRDVIRAAAFSREMSQFRREQFATFLEEFQLEGARLVEIGCGRGEYLALLQEAGAEVTGLEHSAASVAVCRQGGLNVVEGYVETEDYRIPGAPFDGFCIFNFLEHIPEINPFLAGISHNLVPGGIGLVEVPNFEMMLRERLLSEFMTDHLYYFTKDTLAFTLQTNGFEVLRCREVWHDYIVSAVVRKRAPLSLASFREPLQRVQADLDAFLAKFPDKSVVVWGAGHQALAAISLHQLKDRIGFVVDSAPFKQGRFTPASHLPIKSPEHLQSDDRVRAVIVMGAGYSDEIAAVIERDYQLPMAILRSHGLEVRASA